MDPASRVGRVQNHAKPGNQAERGCQLQRRVQPTGICP